MSKEMTMIRAGQRPSAGAARAPALPTREQLVEALYSAGGLTTQHLRAHGHHNYLVSPAGRVIHRAGPEAAIPDLRSSGIVGYGSTVDAAIDDLHTRVVAEMSSTGGHLEVDTDERSRGHWVRIEFDDSAFDDS